MTEKRNSKSEEVSAYSCLQILAQRIKTVIGSLSGENTITSEDNTELFKRTSVTSCKFPG